MATVNKRSYNPRRTHEGAPASPIRAIEELKRSVMACLLWENTFYEDGEEIGERIARLVEQIPDTEAIERVAREARTEQKLRHAPLWIARALAKKGALKAELLSDIIQRADELTEFLALYWKDGKCPLSAQVKKGLASAFTKFDAYALGKYNRDTEIKLRDVLFLSHAKPKDAEQDVLWKQLIDGTLPVPDTWEVALSGGADKKEAFERLLKEKKLGALALLRNLRNMEQARVKPEIIRDGLNSMSTDRVLPFRFLSAAVHAPHFESEMEQVMFRCLSQYPKLSGKTVLVVDVSGSMYGRPLSARSEMNRAKVACSLAVLLREVCSEIRVYATAGCDYTEIHQTAEVPARRGFALSDAIYGMCEHLGGGGIFITPVLNWIKAREESAARIIVITDEQDCARTKPEHSPLKAQPFGDSNYLINVGTDQNGIGYGGKWTAHINGWSESIVNYILEAEKSC